MDTIITALPQNGAENEYLGVSALPDNTVVAMAYVPFQTDTTQYAVDAALKNGTLFKVLNKPFAGGKCR